MAECVIFNILYIGTISKVERSEGEQKEKR